MKINIEIDQSTLKKSLRECLIDMVRDLLGDEEERATSEADEVPAQDLVRRYAEEADKASRLAFNRHKEIVDKLNQMNIDHLDSRVTIDEVDVYMRCARELGEFGPKFFRDKWQEIKEMYRIYRDEGIPGRFISENNGQMSHEDGGNKPFGLKLT